MPRWQANGGLGAGSVIRSNYAATLKWRGEYADKSWRYSLLDIAAACGTVDTVERISGVPPGPNTNTFVSSVYLQRSS